MRETKLSKNKRVATKHIRDGIKSNYCKDSECAICGTEKDLELHHYTTVSLLLQKYAGERGIALDTDEEVLAMRDEFYEVHWKELVDDTVTLCSTHHKLLHKIYGKAPLLHTASKQPLWVLKQKEKFLESPKSTTKKKKSRWTSLI